MENLAVVGHIRDYNQRGKIVTLGTEVHELRKTASIEAVDYK